MGRVKAVPMSYPGIVGVFMFLPDFTVTGLSRSCFHASYKIILSFSLNFLVFCRTLCGKAYWWPMSLEDQ